MKFTTLLGTLLLSSLAFPLASTFVPSLASAQQIDVKGVDGSSEGSTTIEIKKGNKEVTVKPKWEVQTGEADVEGEASATAKDAKAAWKTACADWKKEFRADNKDNKVLSVNCGTADCTGEAGSKICTSKASYKIKTKSEE